MASIVQNELARPSIVSSELSLPTQVSKDTALPFRFPLERGKVAEFARAVFETDPVFFDAEAARAAGFAGIPVPMTYPIICRFFQQPGNDVERGLDMRWTLHGEQHFEYVRIPLVGETLTGSVALGKRREKAGRRGGRLIFQEVITTFDDEAGERVLKMRQVLVQTDGPVEEEGRTNE